MQRTKDRAHAMPQAAEKIFLYKGTSLLMPQADEMIARFSPCAIPHYSQNPQSAFSDTYAVSQHELSDQREGHEGRFRKARSAYAWTASP